MLPKEIVEKKLKILRLLDDVLGVPEMKYFNVNSNELLDEKIEVLEALIEGKPINDIPNFYKVLEDLPQDDKWD